MEASIVDDLEKIHEFNVKQHQNHRYQGQARLSTSTLAPKFALVSSNCRPRYLPYLSLFVRSELKKVEDVLSFYLIDFVG